MALGQFRRVVTMGVVKRVIGGGVGKGLIRRAF